MGVVNRANDGREGTLDRHAARFLYVIYITGSY